MNAFLESFYSQNLPGFYKKKLTIKMCLLFFILGLTNVVLGILTFTTFSKIFSLKIPYPQSGVYRSKFTVRKRVEGPIFLYQQISNFYQSFFQYARGFSSDQLEGEATTSIYNCYPIQYKDNKIVYPCGLIANSYNFDEYKIQFLNEELTFSEKNIAWKSAIDRIKTSSYTIDEVTQPPLWPEYKSVPDLNGDERFANWMLPASFPSFRKLVGRFDGNFEPGEYEIIVDSVTEFGDKQVVLTNSSYLGDSNYFLSSCLIVSGVFFVISTAILWGLRHKYSY